MTGDFQQPFLSSVEVFSLTHIRMKICTFFLFTSTIASQREAAMHQPDDDLQAAGPLEPPGSGRGEQKGSRVGMLLIKTKAGLQRGIRIEGFDQHLGDRAKARAVSQNRTPTEPLTVQELHNGERLEFNNR